MGNTTDTNEFFDVLLTCGAEVLCDRKISPIAEIPESTGVFYNGESALFLESCNDLLDFEVERRIKKGFSHKTYAGSWLFDICDDRGRKIEGAQQAEAAIYLTNVSSHMLPKNGVVKNDGYEWRDIQLVDIVFLGVPREFIANILDNAQHRLLTLANGDKLQKLLKEHFQLHIITAPKSVVSCCSGNPLRPGSTELISILAHQTYDTEVVDYKLTCKKLYNASFDDISDYADCHIVMSNCNVTQQFCACFDDKQEARERPALCVSNRYKNLALTSFLLNIIVAKTAKLRLIRREINRCINESNSGKTKMTKEKLAAINFHIAELTDLWHEKTFVYPITESMARTVYSKFEVDNVKAELDDLQKSFERYMTMYISNEDERAAKKRHKIFEILTLLSGLSTVCSLASYIFSNSEYFLRLGIFFGGIFILILIIYILPVFVGSGFGKRGKDTDGGSPNNKPDKDK